MITMEAIQQLAIFAAEAKKPDFERVFGQMGPHLWSKFSDHYNFDLLALWFRLDTHHQALLVQALNGRE